MCKLVKRILIFVTALLLLLGMTACLTSIENDVASDMNPSVTDPSGVGANERIMIEVSLGSKYTYVSGFGDGLASVRTLENKFGVIDITGKEVIPATLDYDSLGDFHNGLAWAKKDDKFGFIDKTGSVAVPLIYDMADNFDTHGFARVEKGRIENNNRKVGYINKSGREVIPCIYDYVHPFSEGLFGVRNEGKLGFVDHENNIIIPFVYDYDNYASNSFENGLTCVKKDSKWGVIDVNNSVVVPFIYDSIENFSEGLAAVRKDGKYSYINEKNETVITTNYDRAYKFCEGLAVVAKDNRYGYIDKSGSEVIPLAFRNALSFSEGLASVQKSDSPGPFGGYGCIDKTGAYVIEPKYEHINPFFEGFAIYRYDGMAVPGGGVGELGNSYGYLDMTGKEIASGFRAWGPYNDFDQGIAIVMFQSSPAVGRTYGIINTLGEFVLPIEYNDLSSFNGGYATARKGDEWYILRDTMPGTLSGMSSWAAAEVNSLNARGVIPSALKSNFQTSIRRGEFTTLMVNVYESVKGQVTTYSSSFTDIVGSTYKTAIEKAKTIGLIDGTSATKFTPNGLLTREQAAKILCNVVSKIEAIDPKPKDPPNYTDSAAISDWAVGFVAYAQENKIMLGSSSGRFNPQNNLTREEAMLVAERLIVQYGW